MITSQKVGLGVSVVGMIATGANFFRIYGIAGRCPTEDIACAANLYDRWTLFEMISLGVVVLGLGLFVWGIVQKHQSR